MSSTEAWTTKRLLEWTTNFLKESGSDSARLDAEVLLAEAKGCERIQLYTSFDEVPPEDQLATFRGWIKQRAAGTPVAYLVGHREFYSLPFVVNPNVLIPRPETELLVTLAVDFLAESNGSAKQVCDIGTGSGCIPVAIAKNNSSCEITASDISAKALDVAKTNAEQNKVEDRIEFIQSDLFASFPDSAQFDLIVSNPPYIGQKEIDDLAPEVKDHEPHLALFAGEDGLEVIPKLVDQAAERLRPGGQLMFETSPIIMDACFALVNAHAKFDCVEIKKDLAKLPRVVAARRVTES